MAIMVIFWLLLLVWVPPEQLAVTELLLELPEAEVQLWGTTRSSTNGGATSVMTRSSTRLENLTNTWTVSTRRRIATSALGAKGGSRLLLRSGHASSVSFTDHRHRHAVIFIDTYKDSAIEFNFYCHAHQILRSAVFGSIVRQEVMKACSGKFLSLFQKPLESRIFGATCNTEMVTSHLTENYGASRDPPEEQALMCTVHSFPRNIDHWLTCARSELDCLLEEIPVEVHSLLSYLSMCAVSMRKAGDAQARDNLESILVCVDFDRCETFQDCIVWANRSIHKIACETKFEDAATRTGDPFWSAPNRFPRALQVSPADASHLHYIIWYGIPWGSRPDLAEAVDIVMVPEFQPKKDAKIVNDEKATSLSTSSFVAAAVIDDLLSQFHKCSNSLPPGFRMKRIQFEKDDDTNYHMDMIAALANMWARVIPTLAMATGLVCLEFYKGLDGSHNVEDYRNTVTTPALPLFSMAQPVRHLDMSWTVWDHQVNSTLRKLVKWLSAIGSFLVYSSMFPRHKEKMDKKMVDLARDVAKVKVPANGCHIDVARENDLRYFT